MHFHSSLFSSLRLLKRHFILIQPPTIVIRITIIMWGGEKGAGGWGGLSLCTSINRIKWQSASEELKGGDGEWHASLGRLCAANKKCVSVCQSARASGPICASLSLSLSPFIPPAFSSQLGHSQPRRVPAAAALSLSPHWGGCTDTTDQNRERITITITSITVTASPCFISGLFFFLPLFLPGGANGFLIRSIALALWIIASHRRRKGRFVKCRAVCGGG